MLKRIAMLLALLPALVLAQPLDKVVAVVNDNVITASELAAQVALLTRQMQAKQQALPSETALKKQALQHMIDMDIQLQLAKNNNMTVDSTELNDAIERIATNNHITLAQLRAAVVQQGMDWEAYRQSIRKEMLIQQIQQRAVGQDITVSAKQVEDYLQTAAKELNTHATYRLENIVIPLPEKASAEQIKRAENKAHTLLNKIHHGANFSELAGTDADHEFALEQNDLGERHLAELPEVFAKQVVTMKVGDVAGPVRTGNGLQLIHLAAMVENNEHHQVTKTHVRHILLKQAASVTNDEAQKQINNIYQQLKSGIDFADMAKKYSLDVGSAEKGGDLGWVTSDELVPEFVKVMEALPVHQVSQPVKSMFGWHLIEVLERKVVDDSEAFKKQQVHLLLQQKKLAEAVQNWQQHMRAEAYVKVLDKELA